MFSSAALPLIDFASIAVDGSADVTAVADGEGRPAAAATALLPLMLEMSANVAASSVGDAAVLFGAEDGSACFIFGIALLMTKNEGVRASSQKNCRGKGHSL